MSQIRTRLYLVRRLLAAFAAMFSVALSLLLPGVAVAAEGKVLLEFVPGGVAQGDVVAAVREALVGRKWSVVATTADSVTGKLSHNSYDAELRIALVNGSLRYTENTTVQTPMDARIGRSSRAATPDRWIQFLREDITALLSKAQRTTAAAASAPTANAATATAANAPSASASTTSAPNKVEVATQRLQALKGLLDKGLITQAEYEQKRAEAIREL